MNVNPQYWFILLMFVSLAAASTVSVRLRRTLWSILYAAAAWTGLLTASGLMIEPLIANESFTAPDGSITVHFNMTLHTAISYLTVVTSLLATAASIAFVVGSMRQPNQNSTHANG